MACARCRRLSPHCVTCSGVRRRGAKLGAWNPRLHTPPKVIRPSAVLTRVLLCDLTMRIRPCTALARAHPCVALTSA